RSRHPAVGLVSSRPGARGPDALLGHREFHALQGHAAPTTPVRGRRARTGAPPLIRVGGGRREIAAEGPASDQPGTSPRPPPARWAPDANIDPCARRDLW